MDEIGLKSTNVNNSEMSLAASDPSNENWASKFSVRAVLVRSFSIFFKYPSAFLALGIHTQVSGLALTLWMHSKTSDRIAVVVSSFLGLAIQGAIACGVFEVLRGSEERLGKSLVRGLARIVALGKTCPCSCYVRNWQLNYTF